MADFQLLRDRLSTLPVHGVLDAIVKDVVSGAVTIVAASTGSGKSMLLPGAIADVVGHQIVVMVPRRFLATDAAFNVAELAGIKVGDKVGYALGKIDAESSERSSETKVLYCTYGYAINSGLISHARTLILDEVHEADEQISLARAILRKRKIQEPSLQILEMSATVDASSQARYWHPVAETKVHVIEGNALTCDIFHESTRLPGHKSRTAEEITLELLAQGRKGIVLFRPGVKEVENSVAELKKLIGSQAQNAVEIVGIHGGTPSDERRLARRAPLGDHRKIIVGTNVIESGVNLRWLDAGISDGYRKIPYYRDDTGAEALVLEDLPQAGLLQQIGRINRDPHTTGFERGLFILHAQKPLEMRRPQNGPAIQRQSLNNVAFRAASLGHNPTELTWDSIGLMESALLLSRLEQAKSELMRLDLIDDAWVLTEAGNFVRRLPVSPETGAMLWEANRLDVRRTRVLRKPPQVLTDVILMAAIRESHGLRKDTSRGHKGDQLRTSDLLDALNGYKALRQEPLAQKVLAATEIFLASASEEELSELKRERLQLEELCLKRNISLNGFSEVARLSDEISNRLVRSRAQSTFFQEDQNKYDAERYGDLQRCILSAHVNTLFIYENDGFRDLLRDYGKRRNDRGQPFNGYEIARDSMVLPPQEDALLVGYLRELPISYSKDDLPLLVLTDVTLIPAHIFLEWAFERTKVDHKILTDVTIENDELTATYEKKARFDIRLSPKSKISAAPLMSTFKN